MDGPFTFSMSSKLVIRAIYKKTFVPTICLRNKGPLTVLNGTKLILNGHSYSVSTNKQATGREFFCKYGPQHGL